MRVSWSIWCAITAAAGAVSDPVRSVAAALREVGEGRLDVSVPVYDASESFTNDLPRTIRDAENGRGEIGRWLKDIGAQKWAHDNLPKLRNNLGDDTAKVHPVGGIGDAAVAGDYDGFVLAAKRDRAIGWSVYDYVTTSSSASSPGINRSLRRLWSECLGRTPSIGRCHGVAEPRCCGTSASSWRPSWAVATSIDT